MPKLLNDEITRQVSEVFQQLQKPVKALFFGSQQNCDYCEDTLNLVSEVVALSDKLTIDVHDLDQDSQSARQYKVDKAPMIVISGKDGDQTIDYGIRFAGLPAQYEFSTLIHDLLLVSSRDSGLSEQTRQALRNIQEPVLLQVFVTPT